MKKIFRGFLLAMILILSVGLIACSGDNDTIDDDSDVDSVETTDENTNEEDDVVEEDSDVTELVHESTMELDYAENFKVDYFEGGYKIITDAAGRELLLVPEGKEVPELDREVIVKQMPLDDLVIASTVDACWFRAIDSIDKLSGVTYPKENWYIDEIREGLENGDIVFLGKTKALDYELLESIEPDLFMISEASFKNTEGKLEELGIDHFFMGAYLEEDPRGRMEWVKLAGALLDKEDEAKDFYDGEIEKIDNILAEIGDIDDSERPKVANVYWSASKQLFRVTNNYGHTPKTTELAGGLHWPQDLNPEKRGGSDFSNEDFYTAMEDVDIILYDEASGKEVTNKEELLGKAPFVEDLKAFQNDNIFMVRRSMWQAADKIGDVIIELNEIIENPDSDTVDEMDYYYRMK